MGMPTLGRSQPKWQVWINPLIACLLAAVFASAAIAKLVNLTDFLQVVRGYEMFPPHLIPVLSVVLVSFEMTLAVLLVLPGMRRVGATLSALTLLFFIGFVSLALHRGLVVDCGCFVFFQSRSLGIGLLIQDLILLALACVLILRTRPSRRSGPSAPGSNPTPTSRVLASP